MVAFRPDFPRRACQPNTASYKHRFRIALPERSQSGELLDDGAAKLPYRCLAVDNQLGIRMFIFQIIFCVTFQPLSERLYMFAGKRHARCHTVPAETGEAIAAALYRIQY